MAKKIDRLSTTLSRILKARGLEGRLHEYRIFALWDRTVGPAISRHAQPKVLRGKKLALTVDSPAWMQQLSLMKPELIEKLNRELGRETVEDIMMRLGEVAPPNQGEADEQAATVTLSAGEREKIEQSLQGADDRETREALRRLIEKDLLRKKR